MATSQEQYSKEELKILHMALLTLENSSTRAGKKARDDGKTAIAEAIAADTLKITNVRAHTQMLMNIK